MVRVVFEPVLDFDGVAVAAARQFVVDELADHLESRQRFWVREADGSHQVVLQHGTEKRMLLDVRCRPTRRLSGIRSA